MTRIAVLTILVLFSSLFTTVRCDAAKQKNTEAESIPQIVAEPVTVISNTPEIEERCLADMKKLVGRDDTQMKAICKQTKMVTGCRSVHGQPIYHYDRPSKKGQGNRILAFALIHGDEGPSGAVARAWMERLSKIDPQNSWRVVPVLNPDGWEKNTRVNANQIDLNRNFPTEKWKQESQERWVKAEDKDPRRFPGNEAASEPETKCAMTHIDSFKPTFIISVHTPFGVLDFDGPRMKFPEYSDLPWFSLGNFPGSMGRYMWAERKVPVLTIELKGNNMGKELDKFDRLQDVTGIVAIQSDKILRAGGSSKKKQKSEAKVNLNINGYSEDSTQNNRKFSRIK